MLAGAVGGVDPSMLSYDGRMALLAQIEAESARLAGLRARTLAAIEAGDTTSKRWAREEAALVLRVAPVTATAYVKEAVQLVTVLPGTLAALESGVLTAMHARTLVEATYSLDDATAGAVESRCLTAVAAGRGRSVGLFRQLVRRAVAALAPTGPEATADALAQRRVCFRGQDNGTSEVWALLPADDAARLKAALDAAARASRYLPDGTPDPRTADQRRADALTDLTTGGVAAASGCGPVVQVTVAASTLLGLDELPGELDGHGPIPAAMARTIAADQHGTWRRILTDPAGHTLAVSAGYTPPAALRRHVIARDRHCRFPGCTRRVTTCEIDHITAYVDGGPTSAANLHPLCPRHHHLKHDAAGWTVHHSTDGTTTWHTPSGRTIDLPPEHYDDVPAEWTPPCDPPADVGGYWPDAPPPPDQPPDLDDYDDYDDHRSRLAPSAA